jgi:ureidoacrylate peracid hydrolase
MKPINVPQRYIDRVLARGGRVHTVGHLEGSRTALLVVDMQHYFMGPGQPSECAEAREIVPTVNGLAAATRRAGGLVVWIQTRSGEDSLESWSVYYERTTPSRAEARVQGMVPGGSGYDLWPELDVRTGDEVVVKTRFSAFLQGSSPLEDVLRARGIDTILVCGVTASTCCESTARDGMMLNFRALMISDACAQDDDYLREATMVKFYLGFGDVQTSDEVLGMLEQAVVAPSPA